jgi:dihydrofolate reductase
MVKLVYSALTSLDGFYADENGGFDWATPNPDVFEFVNDLERDVGTYLYGRRMYDTMVYWEDFAAASDELACVRDFADIWRAADKIVYSTSLGTVASTKTRIERDFDPASVRQMKETAARDISIGGPNLASQAISAGLVDEMHLFLNPVTIGGGTPALPQHFFSELELLAMDRFDGGVVHLHYRIPT